MPGIGEISGALAAGGLAPGLGTALTPVVDFTNTFIGQLKRIVAPFEMMTNIATHFVQFLDPSIVEDLGRKFRDLNAVIGIAVRPIVDVAREVVKSLSDHLLPIMKKLQPLIEEISRAIGDALDKAIEDMSDTIEGMMPVLNGLKDIIVGIVKILTDLWSIITVIAKTATNVFKGLFETGEDGVSGASAALSKLKEIATIIVDKLGEFVPFLGRLFEMIKNTEVFDKLGEIISSAKAPMDKLRDAIQLVISQLVLFAARLMMAFGWTKGVDALIKALSASAVKAKSEESGGLSVANNAIFKSISDLAKSTQLEAFKASAAGQTKVDPAVQAAEFLGKINDQLKELAKNGKSDDNPVARGIRDIKKVADEVLPTVNSVRKWLEANGEKAGKFITETIPTGITDIINAVRGMGANLANPIDWAKAKATGGITPGQIATAPPTWNGGR